MAYYSELKLRGAPLQSKVITPEALQTLLNFRVGQGGYKSMRLGFATHKLIESYKGFQVPVYVKFHDDIHADKNRLLYFACLIDGQIDLLYLSPETGWPEFHGDTLPTQADLDQCFPRVEGSKQLEQAEAIFSAVLRDSDRLNRPEPTVDEKLAAVRLRPVSEDRLAHLAQLITRLGPDAPFIEALVHSAFNPAGYLKDTGKVETMTLDGCKHFSWYRVFMSGLYKSNRMASIDWKFGVEDVAYNVSAVLGQPFAFKRAPGSDAMGYDLVKAAQDQLWRPGLLRAKHALIMLGDEGDSVAFTIVAKSAAKEVMALAEELGLKPEGPA